MKFAHQHTKQDLHNINAHTKFSENPLTFTQVITRKQIYRWMDGCMTDKRTGRHTHGRLWNHNTPPLDWLIVLGFNNMSTLEGHFVSSPREREKRDRRKSRGDEREGQGRKRNRNESKETEEIKTFPLYPYPLQGQQALPNCKPISWTPQWCKIHSTFAPPDRPQYPATIMWQVYSLIDCVGVQWQVNLCGSFCVFSQRKGEKR